MMRVLSARIAIIFCALCSLSAFLPPGRPSTGSGPRLHGIKEVGCATRRYDDLSMIHQRSSCQNQNLNPLRELKAFGGTFLLFTLFLGSNPNPSFADDWTDYNRLASETWRTVDELFLDRTFNNQDWFGIRQKLVKQTYSSNKEVYEALQNSLSKLGIVFIKSETTLPPPLPSPEYFF